MTDDILTEPPAEEGDDSGMTEGTRSEPVDPDEIEDAPDPEAA